MEVKDSDTSSFTSATSRRRRTSIATSSVGSHFSRERARRCPSPRPPSIRQVVVLITSCSSSKSARCGGAAPGSTSGHVSLRPQDRHDRRRTSRCAERAQGQSRERRRCDGSCMTHSLYITDPTATRLNSTLTCPAWTGTIHSCGRHRYCDHCASSRRDQLQRLRCESDVRRRASGSIRRMTRPVSLLAAVTLSCAVDAERTEVRSPFVATFTPSTVRRSTFDAQDSDSLEVPVLPRATQPSEAAWLRRRP